MTYEEAIVVLATKTCMTTEAWEDFFVCSPAQQALIAKAYADASWVVQRDTFADVLSVLSVIATIAGDVSGVGSAYSVIKALV